MIDKIVQFFLEKRHLLYLLFFVITVATLALTLLPSEHLGQNRLFRYDKLGHFMMFFSWTLAFGFLSFSKKGPENTKIMGIFFAGSLFGIAVETLQLYMPYGRSADIYDAIADILGSLSAAIVLKYIKTKYLNE